VLLQYGASLTMAAELDVVLWIVAAGTSLYAGTCDNDADSHAVLVVLLLVSLQSLSFIILGARMA